MVKVYIEKNYIFLPLHVQDYFALIQRVIVQRTLSVD